MGQHRLNREATTHSAAKNPTLDNTKCLSKTKSQNREEAFRNWILYLTTKNKNATKPPSPAAYKKPSTQLLPALFSEFTLGKNYEFDTNFTKLIKSLIDDGYIVEADGVYCLTENGKTKVQTILANIRYHQYEEYED
jgi:hypothetical protein